MEWRCQQRHGFSLIELVAVIGIIGIVSALFLGLGSGLRARSQTDLARAELARLASSLEAYRAHFGEYPMLQEGFDLFASLMGSEDPMGRQVPSSLRPAPFIQAGLLSLREAADENGKGVEILDPWNSPYVYRYKDVSDTGQWQAPAYVLLSLGPSAENAEESAGLPRDGLIDSSYFEEHPQHDNIVYGF